MNGMLCVELLDTLECAKRRQFCLPACNDFEYRGYDSAGIALQNGGLPFMKQKGSVGALLAAYEESPAKMVGATLGIGHTRLGQPTVTPATATPIHI